MPHVLPPDRAAVAHVARHMRARDWHEIAGVCEGPVVSQCARLADHARFGAVIAADDWTPVAALLLTPLSLGVLGASMFATDRWPEVAITATRHVRRRLIPDALVSGVTRVEARSIESHATAHRWMRHLGARLEARLTDHTPAGDVYLLFAWRRHETTPPTPKGDPPMCFMAPAPKAPPPPPPPPPLPSKSDAEIDKERELERKRQLLSRGRRSTILTGGLGAAADAEPKGKQLFGD